MFPTDADYCETFGHDLITGGVVSPEKYRANNPAGRAILKPAKYVPPTEEPDKQYPFFLTTGRLVHHFHTRTKTGRAENCRLPRLMHSFRLRRRMPRNCVSKTGDWVRITSRRGSIEAQAAIGDIEPGHVFVPFHFGYWDNPDRARAANELTLFEWDAGQQATALQVCRGEAEESFEAIPCRNPRQWTCIQKIIRLRRWRVLAEQASELAKDVISGVEKAIKPERAHLADYIGLLDESEKRLVKGFEQVRKTHPDEPDIDAFASCLPAGPSKRNRC